LRPDQLPELSRKPRLAAFGGSSDPVHNGHIWVAGEVVRRGLADEVLFMPARLPPHKQDRPLTQTAHRLEMLRRATQVSPAFGVSDIELSRTGEPSYTYDTLHLLSTAMPDHDIAFLLGMDSLRELHTWYRAPEIVAHFRILAYPRPGVQPPTYASLAAHFGPRHARRLLDAVIPGEGIPIAATDIRRLAGEGGDLAGLVPESVHAYIAQNALYRTHGPAPPTASQTPAGKAEG
jgi:nicotinate-nucleotide adenylyltransferase